jgi:hypothetical protein
MIRNAHSIKLETLNYEALPALNGQTVLRVLFNFLFLRALAISEPNNN